MRRIHSFESRRCARWNAPARLLICLDVLVSMRAPGRIAATKDDGSTLVIPAAISFMTAFA
jgi:hypothetical protein